MLQGLKAMSIGVFDFVVPRPESRTAKILKDQKDSSDAEVVRISQMNTRAENAASVLDAARTVLKDEDDRKTSTDTRAAAFLAAIATLIPLLTWAIGTATPVCSPGVGCDLWAAAFISAVLYLVAAGAWALATLSVASYHCLGTEDVRKNAASPDFTMIMARETLTNARLNRETINYKVTLFKVALQCFVRGLCLLALLLIIDPILRLHLFGGAEKATAKESSMPASIVLNCPSLLTLEASTAALKIQAPLNIASKPVAAPKSDKQGLSAYICHRQRQDDSQVDH